MELRVVGEGPTTLLVLLSGDPKPQRLYGPLWLKTHLSRQDRPFSSSFYPFETKLLDIKRMDLKQIQRWFLKDMLGVLHFTPGGYFI